MSPPYYYSVWGTPPAGSATAVSPASGETPSRASARPAIATNMAPWGQIATRRPGSVSVGMYNEMLRSWLATSKFHDTSYVWSTAAIAVCDGSARRRLVRYSDRVIQHKQEMALTQWTLLFASVVIRIRQSSILLNCAFHGFRDKYVGRTCSACRDGFGNIAAGCRRCGCHRVGARSDNCDADSGQCVCRPGIGGLTCAECQPEHYGFSASGCRGREGGTRIAGILLVNRHGVTQSTHVI